MSSAKVRIFAALFAHIWAWAATLFFLLAPAYSSGETLIQVNGVWAALLLVIPIALTAAGMIAALPSTLPRALTLTLLWASAALLLLFCAAGVWSVGIPYAPCALALLAAAWAGVGG